MVIIYAVSYLIAILFVKLSILILYLRLSPYPGFRVMVSIVMVVTVVYSLTFSFLIIFRCSSVAMAWNVKITHGSCISVKTIAVINGIINSTTDFAILLLPIPFLWPLSLPKRQRIALVLIYMTSSL
jgi:hypothetical protein